MSQRVKISAEDSGLREALNKAFEPLDVKEPAPLF